jgi:hypothetical protein
MRWQRMSNRRLDLTLEVFAFLELVHFVCNAEGLAAAKDHLLYRLGNRGWSPPHCESR